MSITAEQIPDDVVKAARKALFSNKGMSGAIAAALNAWPGAWHVDADDFESKLILPLPQEGE